MVRRIRRILAIGKSMKPDLDRAKAGDGIDLQAAGNKRPGRMTTHILPGRFDNIGLGEHDPALVMIEFQVVGIEIGIFLQVDDTRVVRAKKDTVLMDDAVIERLVIRLELGIPPLRQPDAKQQRRGNRRDPARIGRDPANLEIFHPPNYDFRHSVSEQFLRFLVLKLPTKHPQISEFFVNS
jgi:hypothetical protein